MQVLTAFFAINPDPINIAKIPLALGDQFKLFHLRGILGSKVKEFGILSDILNGNLYESCFTCNINPILI
jgi:hypothetical protein